MKLRRITCAALLAGAVALAAGCEDAAPLGPASRGPAMQSGLTGWLGPTISLLACSPEPYDSVTVSIGPAGGTVAVGLDTLVVPAGALPTTTAITGVTPPENVDLVRFQPQGLQFRQPASLTMSYANCNLLGLLLPKQIAYVSDSLQILDLLPSLDLRGSVTARLQHFSGYAVAW